MIKLENVTKVYPGGTVAVKDVDLETDLRPLVVLPFQDHLSTHLEREEIVVDDQGEGASGESANSDIERRLGTPPLRSGGVTARPQGKHHEQP